VSRAAVRRTLWLILALNLGVAAVKAAYAWASGSLAVGADAVHSAVDGASNLLGLIAIGLAARPADREHPYGHQRVESLASIFVGLLIAVSAVELGQASIRGLLADRPPPEVSGAGVVALVGTLVVNVFVASYEAHRAKALASSFLLADAAHTASDVVVTLGVLASQLGAWAGLAFVDPAASLAVIVVVLVVAYRIVRASVDHLLDRALVDPERVRAVARQHPGVSGCHRVRSRGLPGAIHVDLHLLCDPGLPLARAHALGHEVERALLEALPEVIDITIHLEPVGDPDDPL